VPKVRVPQNNTYIHRILCHGKFGRENSIYEMRWGADYFANFILLLDDKILDFYGKHWRRFKVLKPKKIMFKFNSNVTQL
jgi:hypothetical protein